MINHFTSFHEFLQSFWMACFLRIRLNNLIIYCITLFPRIRRTIYYTRYHKILHNPFYSNSYDIILHPLQQNTAIPFYSNSYDKILHPLTQNTAQPFLLEIRMTLYYTHYNKILHILFLLELVWQNTTPINTKYCTSLVTRIRVTIYYNKIHLKL